MTKPNTGGRRSPNFLEGLSDCYDRAKGPVYICLDSDVQEAKIDKPMVVPHAQFFRPPPEPGPNPESLRKRVALLGRSQWPVTSPAKSDATRKRCHRCSIWPKPPPGRGGHDSDGRFAFPSIRIH